MGVREKFSFHGPSGCLHHGDSHKPPLVAPPTPRHTGCWVGGHRWESGHPQKRKGQGCFQGITADQITLMLATQMAGTTENIGYMQVRRCEGGTRQTTEGRRVVKQENNNVYEYNYRNYDMVLTT